MLLNESCAKGNSKFQALNRKQIQKSKIKIRITVQKAKVLHSSILVCHVAPWLLSFRHRVVFRLWNFALQHLRGSNGEPLLIEPVTKAEGGLDIEYPIFLAGDAAPLVGDGDDVVELLASVDRYGYLTPLS